VICIIEAVVENLDIKRSLYEKSNSIGGRARSSLRTPAG
jgi:3-hydroxyacyl-CoA dehydrogenase